ncbi:cytochrome c3 family protein [Planctomycetota bacterium]
MKKKRILLLTISMIFVSICTGTAGAELRGSPHDFSATSGASPCSHCHTPHHALGMTPLWNQELSTATYTIYQSSSLDSQVGQPTGASKLCLSCHDGTVALSQMGDGTTMPPGASHLGTDLSDDHPVSFVYSDAIASQDLQIRPASMLPEQLKLDASGELQCTTCHDAHNNQHGKFRAISNLGSAMCLQCHILNGWTLSSHESAMKSLLGSSDPYLQNSEYRHMADTACLCCHRSHSAGRPERLLQAALSEDNCMSCHDGSVAHTNIESSLAKISAHDVRRYNNLHDPREVPADAARHVECVDCHNPHATQSLAASPPLVPGALQGVSGVTATGGIIQEAQYEYEVCFKCHADNLSRIDSVIPRQITQTNCRLEFDPSNPSFHPVEVPGKNPDVPSLIPPRTTSTLIYCTDCHASDSSGTKGPHGSNYTPLLAFNYETDDYTKEGTFAYELCYQCHSRNSILGNESFTKHKEHLEHDTPCSACHDAHGISSGQGNTTENSHLINFDTRMTFPDPQTGRREFNDDGTFHGTCYLTCHGKDHSPESY